MEVRKYFDRYSYFNPNKWVWGPATTFGRIGTLQEQEKWNRIYQKTRMRRSTMEHGIPKDNDLNPPDFHSQERDAEQFGLSEYDVTDTFGLKWHGKKGANVIKGAPDYEGHLYYNSEEYDDECKISEFTPDNPPNPDVFVKFKKDYPFEKNEWIDIKNIKGVEYKYLVDNHLFKDTHIDFWYDEKGEEKDSLYSGDNYKDFIDALKQFGKNNFVEQIFKSMNEHFEKLKNSEREEERDFWPGKTAEEWFND